MLDSDVDSKFKKDTFSATFAGDGSYWIGDEQSWMNVVGVDDTGDTNIENSSSQGPDTFDVTFKNGAQWMYFGVRAVSPNKNVKPIIKRISSIKLEEGGIINLYDENIQDLWDILKLSDVFEDLKTVYYNYVRIGNLKGNGGIFRLDLNVDDKSQSDMIFVENADTTASGTFYIEPYKPELLGNITPENTLRFATVKQGSNIKFADSQNIYGKTLLDYELVIDSEEYNPSDTENNALYEDRVEDDYDYADDTSIQDKVGLDFTTGDINWFIKRVYIKESAASLAMTGAGYATYDAITDLDRYDSRNTDVSRYAGETEGVWVRVKHGENGISNQFDNNYTKATIGYDHYLTPSNRIGVGFTYYSGDVNFDDVNGSGDLTGYEGMIYDTQYFDNQYLDFVFRFGDMKNEFEAVNAAGTMPISSDYHQKYVALSAEYGLRYTDVRGMFFEPQVQFQLAYLADTDYDAQRNMSADIDSAISAIGRAGLKFGKTWDFEDGYTSDVYLRADALHQFTDGQDATYSDGSSTDLDVTWGDKNTWYDLGFGTIIHVGGNFSVAFDMTKSVGGDVTDTWAINGQARLIF